MGIEGIENVQGEQSQPYETPSTEPATERPTDQELMDQRNAELDAEREEHNRRTEGGGETREH